MILLAGLTLLTALVWWRVLSRDDGSASAGSHCPGPSASGSELPRPASVPVSVLNSTNRTGIAAKTAKRLTQLGFKVAGYGNDDPRVHVAGSAEIRYGPEDKDGAALLLYYFPGAKLVPLKSEGPIVVSLGLKFHAVTGSTAAKKALSAAHVSLAPVTHAVSTSPSGTVSC
jgi:hypothetical protein